MGWGVGSGPLMEYSITFYFYIIFFAGAARRAGPDSMLILCQFVCVLCEIISRPLIGRKLGTSPDVVRRS